MPDMIPASRIAAIVKARVTDARKKLEDISVYSHDASSLNGAKAALAVADELLALIVPQPVNDDAVSPQMLTGVIDAIPPIIIASAPAQDDDILF